jgi:hypothetical protein
VPPRPTQQNQVSVRETRARPGGLSVRGGDRVGDADRLVDGQAGGKIGGIGGWGQKCGSSQLRV